MEDKDKLQLSEHTQSLLAKYQDKIVASKQKQVEELRAMSLIEFLARGIDLDAAPFELKGRLISQGWKSLIYNHNKAGWEAWTTDYRSLLNLTAEQVQNMLEAEE